MSFSLTVLFCVSQAQKQSRIQRRGACFALTAISLYFGRDLPHKLPKFWEIMIDHLKDAVDLTTFGEHSVVNFLFSS